MKDTKECGAALSVPEVKLLITPRLDCCTLFSSLVTPVTHRCRLRHRPASLQWLIRTWRRTSHVSRPNIPPAGGSTSPGSNVSVVPSPVRPQVCPHLWLPMAFGPLCLQLRKWTWQSCLSRSISAAIWRFGGPPVVLSSTHHSTLSAWQTSPFSVSLVKPLITLHF